MNALTRRGVLAGSGAVAVAGALGHSAAPAQAASRGGRALIGKAKRHEIHVMSFNIRLDRSSSTRPGEPDHWPERRPLVTQLLETERPTLLGVQEAQFGQLGAIEDALPQHKMLGYGRKGGSKDEYSAIFYDSTRYEVLEWDQFWLSDTPQVIGSATWGNTVTRIVVWARLRDVRRGTEFAMVNTHFDHQSEPARIKSADAILALATDELAGLPLLVTGDFNSSAHRSGAYETLVGAGPLLDTWDVAEDQLTPAWNTFPGYKDPVAGNDRIDWVLSSKDVRVKRAAINVFRDKNGRYPSDHAPVQALVQL